VVNSLESGPFTEEEKKNEGAAPRLSD